MLGIIGVVLSLILLMYLAYRGFSVLVLAPLMATVAVVFAAGPILANYTQIYLPAVAGYIGTYLPIFLLGAIFGKAMDDTGAAKAIAVAIVNRLGARNAVLAVVLSCAILTYGGVSLFVVAFAVFPIAVNLYREADIPFRLIPGAIALGAFTFTMTGLPGSPQIQNSIPAPFFGTDAFAAPGIGIIASLIMFGGGMWWLLRRAKVAQKAGEGFRESASKKLEESERAEAERESEKGDHSPSLILSVLPLVLVIAINLVLVRWVYPALDFSYLAEEQWGGVEIDDVAAIWALTTALVVAIIVLFATLGRRMKDAKKTLNEGAFGSLLPAFNTACEVGYGAVIAALPAFAIIRDGVLGISSNPAISAAVATNVLAGITGSSSGGMSIALETLGEQFRTMAEAQGIDLELMHRVVTLSAGSFDTLPHSGAIITLLAITGMTHRKSYADIAMCTIVFPLISAAVAVLLGSIFGAF